MAITALGAVLLLLPILHAVAALNLELELLSTAAIELIGPDGGAASFEGGCGGFDLGFDRVSRIPTPYAARHLPRGEAPYLVAVLAG